MVVEEEEAAEPEGEKKEKKKKKKKDKDREKSDEWKWRAIFCYIIFRNSSFIGVLFLMFKRIPFLRSRESNAFFITQTQRQAKSSSFYIKCTF